MFYFGEIITEENGQLELQTERYTFNTNNQLIKSINNGKITTYTYSPSGLRDTKTTEGNTIGYYYDRGNVIIETENGRLKARNLRGHQLISREEGRITAYYLFNGHGDVVQLIDESGEIAANYEYDIYGLERQSEEDIISNPYRYSGEYYDEETGLYYLRARYYDPELGRFISEDTYKGNMQDPLTLNYYIYCKGNPIKYIDPSGNVAESAGELSKLAEIIAAIGGMLYNAGGIVKNATPAGVFVTVLLTPEKAGETEEDLKNDIDFQKRLSEKRDNNNENKNDNDSNKENQNGKIETPNSSPKKFTKLKGDQGYASLLFFWYICE